MKICVFGKYPPIEGGVSTRTYRETHELAKLGHTVHVVTNAKEATLPLRMYMRNEDWIRCEAQYETGSVTVHWTDVYGRRENHIPRGTPFITKLASLGLKLAKERAIDIIYSYYVEPYGVAAHLVAQATGLPHVARTAGSDSGRLWSLPQFSMCYDHIFKSANAILCGPAVARKMIKAGISPAHLALDPEIVRLRDEFSPEREPLDVEALRMQVRSGGDGEFEGVLFGTFDPRLSYFGAYGKLGRSKGSYALLTALKRLKDRGLSAGLLLMAQESPISQGAFRESVVQNGLEDRVCQLPLLPHWRVPEFINRCVAICCLEQDFAIRFHTPVVAREVLTCGGCLIASTEIIQKLPAAHKLIDGHNCIAVKDVNDVEDLESRMISVLENTNRVQSIRPNAREYGMAVEANSKFPQRLQSILRDIVETGRLSPPNIRKVADQVRDAEMTSATLKETAASGAS